jgi:hypothetical protein
MEDREKESTGNDPKTSQGSRSNIGRNVAIAVSVVLLLAIIGAAIYGMVTHPFITARLRDIFIIALALVTILIGLFLMVLIFQLQSLIVLLRDELKPILESTNQTVSTVRGTTTFVSDTVVHPVITVASYLSGVRETVKVLAGDGRKQKKAGRRQEATPDE